MESQRSKATEDARHAAEGGPTERFLENLADRIGARAGVEAVFGEPLQRGDLTVVPVARVRWFFAGGSGAGGDQTAGVQPARGPVAVVVWPPTQWATSRSDRPAPRSSRSCSHTRAPCSSSPPASPRHSSCVPSRAWSAAKRSRRPRWTSGRSTRRSARAS